MIRFPEGFRCETLRKSHRRTAFASGRPAVDAWLTERALQSQKKHLSVTRVLVDPVGEIAGYFTLGTAQVDLGDLPDDVTRHLPNRGLPVAVIAWLGIDRRHQGSGLGTRLLARALADCYEASRTFPFVAVILDCLDEAAKTFYSRWDFREMPGRPMRLFLTAAQLEAMMTEE